MKRSTARVIVIALALLGVSTLLVLTKQPIFKHSSFDERPHIVVVLKTMESLQFWQVMRDGLDLAAKEFNVEITIVGPANESEIEEQMMLMEQAIARKPDAIVLAATDYDRLTESVEAAATEGIPVFMIDSEVNSDLPVSVIATDNFSAGKKAGSRVIQELEVDLDAQVAIISLAKGSASLMEREKGVREALEHSSDIHIIDTFYSEGSLTVAYRIATTLLRNYPELSGIVALNEPTAVAAGHAIKDLQADGKLKLFGFDSSMDEVKFLEEGVMQATVVQRPFNMGYLTVKTAVDYLNGHSVEPRIDTGSVLISKQNMYYSEYQQLIFPFVD